MIDHSTLGSGLRVSMRDAFVGVLTSPLDWLYNARQRWPMGVALKTGEESISFAQLFMRAGTWAARYEASGLMPQRPLAVISQDITEIALASYLAMFLGCPLLPIDPQRGNSRFLLDMVESCQGLVGSGAQSVDVPERLTIHSTEWLFDSSAGSARQPEPPHLDAAYWLLPTSGTQGLPRVVVLSARNLAAAVTAARLRVRLSPGDVWLVCLPLFHVGGLSILLRCLQAGATPLLQARFDAQQVWYVLEQERVTHISLIPAMLAQLLAVGAGAQPPRHLRVALVGGGAIDEHLIHRAHQAGWPLCVTYGMTETGSQIATYCAVDNQWRAGDMGRPLPGVQVRIVNEAGQTVQGVGRIQICGPMVAAGYMEEGLLPVVHPQNTFTSTDLGYLDNRGHVRIIGRADDVLVSGGKNVHPNEIEQQLRGCEGLEDVAVTGRPDCIWGQRIVAFFVGALTSAELEAWCRTHLPNALRPREFIRVPRLPRNALGKLERWRLRDWLDP